MNNLKTNLDSIILLLCQASSDHDAQLAEKDQLISDLQGWLNVERALRLETIERIKELSDLNSSLDRDLKRETELRYVLQSKSNVLYRSIDTKGVQIEQLIQENIKLKKQLDELRSYLGQ